MTKQRRTKGDGALYKRGDGMWIGRVELPSLDGKRRYKSVSSRDRNVCIGKLKKLRADVDAGRIAVTGHTTVEKWLTRWLSDIHGTELRPTTYKLYASVIRLHINPHIGSKRLDRLTPEHVRQMVRAIQAKDQTRTAQVTYIVINRALQDAVGEGMLARNAAAVVHNPKHAPQSRQPLTAVQVKQLLRATINDALATRWAAAFLLGARQGELLGLQWSRVDLDNGVIDLAWQLQQLEQVHGCGVQVDKVWPCGRHRPGWCPDRRWDLPAGFEHQILHRSLALTRPKSKAGSRIVPIPAPLWALLERQQRIDSPHDLVWCHSDGRPIGPRDDYTHWQDALKTADLPAAPLHAARHTTATLLLEAGVSEAVRMEILGHASVGVTRGYAHIDTTQTRQAMSSLDRLLELN